jgi:hypothetical protein
MHCRGCLHRDRDNLDRQIIDGVPFRRLAVSFNLSLGALSRHKGHIKEMIQPRSQDEREEHGSALLERVQKLIGEAEEILMAAKAKNDFRGANGALGAAAKLLDLCGRLSGELQSANAGGIHLTLNRTTKTIINNYGDSDPEWATMLFEATRGFDPAEITRLKAIAEKQLCENSVILPAQSIES